MTTPLEEIVSGLREAAEKATPGPWVTEHDERGYTEWEISSEPTDRPICSVHTGRDAAYIAAANPQALLSVLDAFQAQAARIAELEAHVKEESARGDYWFDIATYEVGGAPQHWKDRAETAERDLAAAVEERDALKAETIKALTPFAEASASYDPPEGDDNHMAWSHDFPIGALRRAAATLAKLKGTAK
jgi:hypothetical protein